MNNKDIKEVSKIFNKNNFKNFNQNQIIKLTLENTEDYKGVLNILISVSRSKK